MIGLVDGGNVKIVMGKEEALELYYFFDDKNVGVFSGASIELEELLEKLMIE